MILERFPEIRNLPAEELELLKWEIETLLRGFLDEEVTDPEVLRLLQQRWAHYLEHPETARPVDEVMARVRARVRKTPVDVQQAIGTVYREFPDEPRRTTAEWMEELRGGEPR